MLEGPASLSTRVRIQVSSEHCVFLSKNWAITRLGPTGMNTGSTCFGTEAALLLFAYLDTSI